jgi:RNA recognition motif-containing protein
MNIYIGNLPYQTNESEIKTLFSKYGEVTSVKLITDKATGRKKGFGFVDMDDASGQEAINALNETEFNGRNLKVNAAKFENEGQNRRNNY